MAFLPCLLHCFMPAGRWMRLRRSGLLVLCLGCLLSISACSKGGGAEPDPPAPPPPDPEPEYALSTRAALVNDKATPEAKKVYEFLRKQFGRKIISGVMTLNSFDEVNWLKENTGKEPGIVGLDFMHCFRGYTWYNDQEPVNDAIAYWNRKGLPVFCWHWRDPSRATEAFYTSGTSFDVSKISDPASAEYKAMLADIDALAGQLKILQDRKVPVLWRPLHEAAGGWFWWGAKGGAACKQLYITMYQRLVEHHQLNNLIWIWTREANDTDWYPGDAYVDIIGRDIYQQGNHGAQTAEWNAIRSGYGNNKLVALSECGSNPDPDLLQREKGYWSWFMTWYGDFVRKPEHNTLDGWKKIMNSGYVLTLDEMPSLQ
ncbi:MAG: glycosyl hydrolase [Candidatus Pseudobacter hemicellulosilyticus]|uniref:Glycosyl hydrolase n=1 Tax=Candidatus Pseudobacter hemicellulosilyticus TaxID=3121375 RepID=A0AAJ5WLQ6_9BACT|nr:MAG: glycosyl hydrolase [Pseudobacter sp.]